MTKRTDLSITVSRVQSTLSRLDFAAAQLGRIGDDESAELARDARRLRERVEAYRDLKEMALEQLDAIAAAPERPEHQEAIAAVGWELEWEIFLPAGSTALVRDLTAEGARKGWPYVEGVRLHTIYDRAGEIVWLCERKTA